MFHERPVQRFENLVLAGAGYDINFLDSEMWVVGLK
jgi:hypothetical protein